jgi:hypothetical protein
VNRSSLHAIFGCFHYDFPEFLRGNLGFCGKISHELRNLG